jgi:hypothetical protein
MAIAAAAAACFAVACGDLPVGTDDGLPSFKVAGNSGCYTVRGMIEETGAPWWPEPNFEGSISGDLVGDVESQVGAGWCAGKGAACFGPEEHWYTISGGTVPPLIGQTLHVEDTGNLAGGPVVWTRDNPGVARINGIQHVQSPGTGKLSVHGTLDATTFPFEVVLRYNGRLCP